MSLLLHICCAPCSVACIGELRQEGLEPVGYWFNPNIHPYTEYRMRRNTLQDYAKSIGLKLELKVDDEELARRRAAWKPRKPKITTGYLARYAAMVTSGNRGAVLEIPGTNE